jgi:hypothetical protein
MGLIVKKNVAKNCLLGVWEIQENFDFLLGKLKLTSEELTTLNSFQSHQRKLEWLSVRVLMNEIIEKNV